MNHADATNFYAFDLKAKRPYYVIAEIKEGVPHEVRHGTPSVCEILAVAEKADYRYRVYAKDLDKGKETNARKTEVTERSEAGKED